jgi:urocanate hydratase
VERVLTNDPAMGVLRHVDAGYPEADVAAATNHLTIPMVPAAAAADQPAGPTSGSGA